MQNQPFQEGDRAALRRLTAQIDRDLAALPSPSPELSGPTETLRADWRGLLARLDLGEPPLCRSCPVCQHSGLRAATRCGYCWTALAPL